LRTGLARTIFIVGPEHNLKEAVPVFDEIMLNSKRWSGMTIRGKVVALEEISSQPHRAFS